MASFIISSQTVMENKPQSNNKLSIFNIIFWKNYFGENTKDVKISRKKIKAALNLLHSSRTAMDVIYSNMPHNDGNVDKKIRGLALIAADIKNSFPPLQTDRQLKLSISFETKKEK